MSTWSRDRSSAAARDPDDGHEVPASRLVPVSPAFVAAAALAVVALAMGIAAIAFVVMPTLPGVAGPSVAPYQVAADATLLIVTPLLGLFLAGRVPGNPIGYLFTASSSARVRPFFTTLAT